MCTLSAPESLTGLPLRCGRSHLQCGEIRNELNLHGNPDGNLNATYLQHRLNIAHSLQPGPEQRKHAAKTPSTPAGAPWIRLRIAVTNYFCLASESQMRSCIWS